MTDAAHQANCPVCSEPMLGCTCDDDWPQAKSWAAGHYEHDPADDGRLCRVCGAEVLRYGRLGGSPKVYCGPRCRTVRHNSQRTKRKDI